MIIAAVVASHSVTVAVICVVAHYTAPATGGDSAAIFLRVAIMLAFSAIIGLGMSALHGSQFAPPQW